jgi:hypothetical protein
MKATTIKEVIMRTKATALMAMLFVLMALGLPGKPAPADSLTEKIQKASSLLLDSEKSEDKSQGFLLLVEAVDLAAAGGSFPAGFQEEIRGALEILHKGSILDQQGGDKLKKAYALINSGKSFEMPAKISSIDQAVEYGRSQIGAALTQVKAGKNADAVKPLLEVLLMVITPMEAQG